MSSNIIVICVYVCSCQCVGGTGTGQGETGTDDVRRGRRGMRGKGTKYLYNGQFCHLCPIIVVWSQSASQWGTGDGGKRHWTLVVATRTIRSQVLSGSCEGWSSRVPQADSCVCVLFSACLYVCKSLWVCLCLWGKALCNSGNNFQLFLNTKLTLPNSTGTSLYRRPWWVRFSTACDVCVDSRVVLSLMFGPVWLNRWVGGDDRIQGIPRCSFYLIPLQKSHTHTHRNITKITSWEEKRFSPWHS